MSPVPRSFCAALVLPAIAAGMAGCRNSADTGTGTAVTTGSLYREMTDLAALAEFPEPAFRTVQFSSYDRRSALPEGPYWFANSDGFGGEPIPGFEAVLTPPDSTGVGEYLIADVEGPGAVVRLWTALIAGDVRMFLDGATEPLFDGTADDFFRRPLGAFAEAFDLDPERMDGTLVQRDGVYLPIPFAKRLRLVWIGKLEDTHFYQVEVRRYEPGTRVETFRPQDLRTYRDEIDEAMTALADPDAATIPGDPTPISVTLRPGEACDVLALHGPGALRRLELRLEASNTTDALRQTVLLVYADGYPTPQVESPAGDFFGAAPGINPYRSLPFTVLPDGSLISRWVMPYADSMRVRLDNRGDQPITVRGTGTAAPYEWDERRSMHFRARWRVDHGMVPDPRAVQDLPFLVAVGEGVYVGTTSLLWNPSPVPTPSGSWWGEGDEKVFVDGETRPSLFGTGSEDYYNYSWSVPDIFAYPYSGQPRNDGPGNRGFVTNYRWHVLDPLPFRENVRFYMEAYPHERVPGLSYARIGYHYGRPGITDDHVAIAPEDLRPPRRSGPWMPAGRRGAANSVFYQAEELPGGTAGGFRTDLMFAGGRLPVWRPAAPGATWTITVPVNESGRVRVHFVALLDEGSPSVRVRFDGEPADLTTGSDTADLNMPYRTLLRNFTLEPRDLTAGRHTLEFVYEGEPAGVARPAMGLDFVWVQKAQ